MSDRSGNDEKRPLLVSTTALVNPSSAYDAGESPRSSDSAHSSKQEFAVYRRRWWIIFVFAMCSMVQSAQWNTWAPITDALQISYNWPASLISSIPATSNAGFCLLGLPVMALIETQGKTDNFYLIYDSLVFNV